MNSRPSAERPPADRRAEHLERTMFALQDAREPDDVLTIVGRAIAREFRRPCTPYDLRDGRLRSIGASRQNVPDDVDFDDLRHRGIVRHGEDDLVGVVFDGAARAFFALGGPAEPLGDDDRKQLRAIAAYASLALSSARAFEAMRRSAGEGAALTNAARTILGFNELEPLAEALCRLGVGLGLAARAAFYARRGEGLQRIGFVSRPAEAPLPESLPPDEPTGTRGLHGALGGDAFLARRVALHAGDDGAGDGALFVLARAHRFSRADLRLWEALVSLAALALRNVELYEQAMRANRALAESNAFKDDLMAMFAHDFKGPLTVISGFAELLLETDDAAVRQRARTIVEQATRLAKLSEDALALAATQSAGFSLQRSDSDIVRFVTESVAPLDRGGRIVVDAPDGPLVVAFDRARLRHVLDNVVGNALKYSNDAVHIAVRRMTSPSGNGGVRIEVTDRGIGIPAGDLERIFTRFGRAANARSRGVAGSGVGLYVAKKIVEVHGGRLDVRSVEDEGSTFSIALPRG